MRSFCTDSKEEEIILGWFTYLDSDLLSIDFFFLVDIYNPMKLKVEVAFV